MTVPSVSTTTTNNRKGAAVRRRYPALIISALLLFVLTIVSYFLILGKTDFSAPQEKQLKMGKGSKEGDRPQTTQSKSAVAKHQQDRDGPAVIQQENNEVRKEEEGSSACSQYSSSCLDCLFLSSPKNNRGDKHPACVWCASEAKCIPFHQQPSSYEGNCALDLETRSCSAILHSQVPQHFRVLHVGIKKGGPEALIQLHLALHYWGFHTTLDTRKSKKQKGGEVVEFFKRVYAKEFSTAPGIRWFKDFEDWHEKAVEGDVLMATETWQCPTAGKAKLAKGIRQFQWHLTVWPRKDRSACTVAGHTDYIATTYMKLSRRAVFFPYITPYILQIAEEKRGAVGKNKQKKENLVMYDHDTQLKPNDLDSTKHFPQGGESATKYPLVPHDTKLASGYKPEQLYELYNRAKVGIDLNLPGGERFVYEASLFDVCIVIDKASNGVNINDFPGIPDRFKVEPKNLVALNEAKNDCLYNYENVIGKFNPLKNFVLNQRPKFYRSIRRYFSNSVHVVTTVCSQEIADKFLGRFILQTLIQIPFAMIEIRVLEGIDLTKKESNAKLMKALMEFSYMASVLIVKFSVKTTTKDNNKDALSSVCDMFSSLPESPSAGGANVYMEYLTFPKGETLSGRQQNHHQLPSIQTNTQRTLYTLLLPIQESVIHAEDFIHFCGSVIALAKKKTLGKSEGAMGQSPLIVLHGENFVFRETLNADRGVDTSVRPCYLGSNKELMKKQGKRGGVGSAPGELMNCVATRVLHWTKKEEGREDVIMDLDGDHLTSSQDQPLPLLDHPLPTSVPKPSGKLTVDDVQFFCTHPLWREFLDERSDCKAV